MLLRVRVSNVFNQTVLSEAKKELDGMFYPQGLARLEKAPLGEGQDSFLYYDLVKKGSKVKPKFLQEKMEEEVDHVRVITCELIPESDTSDDLGSEAASPKEIVKVKGPLGKTGKG